MPILEKIRLLANQHGTDIANLERTLGMGNGVIRRWDKASPTCDKLLKVANYFDVTIDYLLKDDEKNSEQDNSICDKSDISIDNKIIFLLKNASDLDKERVLNYLSFAVDNNSSNFYTNKILKDIQSNYYAHTDKDVKKLFNIPLRGYVAAGTPIEAINNDLGTTTSSLADADYALIVNGNSMYPLIKDGDYVFVKSCKELNNGDIGVFYYNGSVTCKKYFKNDSILKLISINPAFEDFTFSLKDQKNEFIDFTIEGKVILSESQKNNQ